MLTQVAIQEFLESRGGLRPKTQAEYRKHLALFERAFSELPETPQPIQSWLNSFLTLTPESVAFRFATVRAFYRQLHLWHPEVPNPMPLVRPPAIRSKAMRTFADEELYRLFSLSLSAREHALLTLLLDIGPRADECAHLTWGDVIPGYATLRGKTGERIVPISDITYRRLDLLRAGDGAAPQQRIFLGKRGPLTYEGIYKLVRRLCHRAGVTGRRCSPHTFRHSFASIYAATEGCDPKVLQDILGHKDFKMTLRYIQNNPRRMTQNHRHCTPLRVLAGVAQGSFRWKDDSQAVKEAEEILTKKGGKDGV